MKLSDDSNRFEVGIEVLDTQLTFILKFYMYDEVSKDYDYQITKSFSTIYSASVELIVSFPSPVMISQKRPPHEIRIDHIDDLKEELFYLPGDTYAYTTQTPYIMQFNQEVSIDSFWLRIHRSPKAYIEKSEGTRTVQVLKNSQVVAETTFVLTSDEWVHLKPRAGKSSIIGDTIWIDANTDIDNIVVSWGDAVKQVDKLREIEIKLGLNIQEFIGFKLFPMDAP